MTRAISVALGVLLSTQAVAQEERELTDTTRDWWDSGMTSQEVTAVINSGYRLINLEVESTSPWRFTGTFVENSGAYASAFWWYYGVTEAQLTTYLNTNHARLIDIETVFVNGQRRVAAVMVDNTGANNKAWWWYYGQSEAQLSQRVSQNHARIIDRDSYVEGGVRKVAAIMIANTGADAKSWWYYYNVTPTTISQKVRDNGAHIIDLDPIGNGRYDVVMVESLGEYWYYYYGRTAAQLDDLFCDNDSRPIDIESRIVGGARLFDVVMLENQFFFSCNTP